MSDDLTLDLGLRYDRQTLTDGDEELRAASRLRLASERRFAPRVRGGYAMYYTQIRANAIASALTGGLDGITTYTATPGQTGFPTCLTGPCLPVPIDPRTLPARSAGAQHHDPGRRRRTSTSRSSRSYGLNFDLLPNYPDDVREPAQPGDVDRRRARDRRGAVRRRGLRASALDRTSIARST